LASSNALSATDESTKIHNNVSNTAEASCGGDWGFFELSESVFFFPSLEEVEDESPDCCWSWWVEEGEEKCRETSKRSTRIYNTNGLDLLKRWEI
jgi:hypothetical protein